MPACGRVRSAGHGGLRRRDSALLGPGRPLPVRPLGRRVPTAIRAQDRVDQAVVPSLRRGQITPSLHVGFDGFERSVYPFG